jgi:hypothetical protein
MSDKEQISQIGHFPVFIPTTAQELDTQVYNHTADLLHFSAFIGRFQEGTRKKNTTLANYVIDVQL